VKDTILPPPSSHPDEGFRLPYANEFILLSFEGHLKPFARGPLKYGEMPSYVPGALPAPRRPSLARRVLLWLHIV
jgi:hypothetical protein